jgi:ATP-dependent phosphofructokinase / diphosphate-dependent phosphofructokinase
MPKIGILNSGGDCSGLNSVIASIVKAGLKMGYEFIGFELGWEGVLSPMTYRVLDIDAVRGISHLGGTILKTANHGRFAGKSGGKDSSPAIPPDILQMAKDNLDSIGVDALIVIGGDGTLSAAMQLSDYGVPIIGVPKTIDNDLSATDETFGFESAVAVAVEALDKIHTTATSHNRVFLVECMGRHAGWITLSAGLAANANAILLPEFEVNVSSVIEFIRNRSKTRGSTIIAVAEGIDLGQEHVSVGITSSEVRVGGAAETLMHMIEESAPKEFEMRHVVLGHTQRGGSPIPHDRILAKRFGVAAIEAFRDGKFGQMVSLRENEIITVPIRSASSALKLVTHHSPLYKTAQKLGVYTN